MTLEEAQELSVSGVAVLGNPAMQDVIWPKGAPAPFAWITNGYVEMKNPEVMRERDGWSPLHKRHDKEKADKYRQETIAALAKTCLKT
jgi:hypothetical protein